jgi:hypothetical protein
MMRFAVAGVAVALGLASAALAQTQEPAAAAPGGLIPPPPVAQPAAPDPVPPVTGADLSMDIAVLGGLDKITARVVTVEAPVGRPVHLGTLEIYVRACKKRRPEENPESAAFLDVWDVKEGLPAQSLFRGWMFASSPALSAMEHPIYDLWVLDCKASRK